MLAANWDRMPWDTEKLSTWLGMLLEVRPDMTPIYTLRESQWAVRYLLRTFEYPHLQFSDFEDAVQEHRRRVRLRRKELQDMKESEEFRKLKGDKLVSIGSLLQLAAPRKVPTPNE